MLTLSPSEKSNNEPSIESGWGNSDMVRSSFGLVGLGLLDHTYQCGLYHILHWRPEVYGCYQPELGTDLWVRCYW